MEALILEPSLYTVKAILILDNDGDRLFAKYYDDTYPSVKEQKAFEKNIFNKTHRTDSEIALLEGLTVVYKSSIDLYFYVIGSSYENELMLMAVLNCLFDSLSQMLRKNVEKRALLENMEGLFLAVDEIVDGGVKMFRLQSRPCLRCCSQPKSRSSGHSFGEDLTVPGSSPPQKIHISAVTSHPVPQLMLSGSSRGSQGILKSPSSLWLLPQTPTYASYSFTLFFFLTAWE
ncbi:coatomer subunit zeta-1 isoform X2 [Prionailurus bengalensis]|uniref:coatomer subunit zeta-1 isoform X2 n=1 Tax=Prionailurus bengalensis TaxID=37029 RepID=UPI001CA85B34|nr:coatomer subunit zeta-1 isoform X2 [Prionailurus bengalensis]